MIKVMLITESQGKAGAEAAAATEAPQLRLPTAAAPGLTYSALTLTVLLNFSKHFTYVNSQHPYRFTGDLWRHRAGKRLAHGWYTTGSGSRAGVSAWSLGSYPHPDLAL